MTLRSTHTRPIAVLVAVVVSGAGVPASVGAAAPDSPPPDHVWLVSESLDGGPGSDDSVGPSMTRDGRLIAFSSRASDLVEDDDNGAYDVFVHDRPADTITRVNLAIGGGEGDADSFGAVISADGSTVAFASLATNLVEDEVNDQVQIYHLDLATGQTTLVTRGVDGEAGNQPSQAPVVSADGRYVAYATDASNLITGDANGQTDVFVWDAQRDRTRLVSATPEGSVGNGPSGSPSITDDASIIAFDSYATDLTDRVDTNGLADVFLYRDGVVNMITMDGRDHAVGGSGPVLSPDASHIAFGTAHAYAPRDDNGTTDVYTLNAVTGRLRLLSATPEGAAANGNSHVEDVSAHARSVTFFSWADDLVAGDDNLSTDVFVRNRRQDVALVSKRPDGTPGDLASYGSSMDRRGRVIAFGSGATDLVADDPGFSVDVFLYRQPRDG